MLSFMYTSSSPSFTLLLHIFFVRSILCDFPSCDILFENIDWTHAICTTARISKQCAEFCDDRSSFERIYDQRSLAPVKIEEKPPTNLVSRIAVTSIPETADLFTESFYPIKSFLVEQEKETVELSTAPKQTLNRRLNLAQSTLFNMEDRKQETSLQAGNSLKYPAKSNMLQTRQNFAATRIPVPATVIRQAEHATTIEQKVGSFVQQLDAETSQEITYFEKIITTTESSALICDGYTPCVPLAPANKLFKDCCIKQELPQGCVDKCRYNISVSELKDTVMRGKCPWFEMKDYLSCAANFKDNRACCLKSRVYTPKTQFCEFYCNPTSEQIPSSADLKKITSCMRNFRSLMKCHWAAVRT